jgi:3D-(3,5/4)-trihydroxycyclohexane-1,2-dione acylhydrolase (decyclizing)
MGCRSENVTSVAELEAAMERARASDRTYVIGISTSAYDWTGGGAFWEVGVPEVSGRPDVVAAREAMDAGKAAQRVGW